MMNGSAGLRHRVPESKGPGPPPMVNPFVHEVKLASLEVLKCCIMTVFVLPIRVITVFGCLLTAYLLACLGMLGLSSEDMRLKPMKGWRRQLRTVICWWMCKMFFNMGFYRVTIKGIRASERDAPILALAPHSSWCDAFPVVLLTAPSLVVKAESQSVPFFHKLINYTQPVYVWREDPDSRQNTIKEIHRRVKSGDDWQQILIFPEGTCTNRTGLISFKPGAFIPGVPVQPVCIRYPNRLDTLSWTWQGPGALKLLWLTMTQFCTYCELEFLPVYVPSDEEKQNPRLFANHVRDVMAKALQVPVVDYSYEDCRLMNKAQKLGLPASIGLIEVNNVREKHGLDVDVLENSMLKTFAQFADPTNGLATEEQFSRYLLLPVDHPKSIEIFRICEPDRSGTITFRKYVCGRCCMNEAVKKRPRPAQSSWSEVKRLLNLTPECLDTIDGFIGQDEETNSNESDILDRLCAAIPEWDYIVSSLCSK